VALLFAFRHPEHERRLAAALRGARAAVPVAASHEVLPVFREFERFSTTTVEAYLRPKVSSYLARLEREARSRIGTLRIMTSTGGTLAPPAAACRAAALALSGPAGGVVGAQLVGAAVGLSELLTLDMGGTSADASLVTGGTAVHEGGGAVAGIPLALPSILIETVRRGERSHRHRLRYRRGGERRDGPRSAARERGARARPAAHGPGGVRRRRPAVRLCARRRTRHAHARHSAAPGRAVRPRTRRRRGARGRARVLSPRARRAAADRHRAGVQPAPAGRQRAAPRRGPVEVCRLPLRR